MGDRLEELGSATVVALITFTSTTELATYLGRTSLPFDILIDPERVGYRAYGLGRGSFWRIWGVRTMRRYAAIVRRDGFADVRSPTEDTRQLGGDFVVAPDGTLAWGFWSAGPDDRPSVDELIAAVSSVGS